MKLKTIINHVFLSLLFCVAWQLVCWNADEFNGGVLFEKFYDIVKSLPFASDPENPLSFAMAFFIYPLFLYWSVVAIWYAISRQKSKVA